MIHKYLLLGRSMSLSSIRVENPEERHGSIELVLPLDVFWQVSESLQRSNFLLSQDAPVADVQKLYQKIYAEVFPYAANENERALLQKRMVGG